MSADIDNGGSITTAVDSDVYESTASAVATHSDIFRPLKAKNTVQDRGNINRERYS